MVAARDRFTVAAGLTPRRTGLARRADNSDAAARAAIEPTYEWATDGAVRGPQAAVGRRSSRLKVPITRVTITARRRDRRYAGQSRRDLRAALRVQAFEAMRRRAARGSWWLAMQAAWSAGGARSASLSRSRPPRARRGRRRRRRHDCRRPCRRRRSGTACFSPRRMRRRRHSTSPSRRSVSSTRPSDTCVRVRRRRRRRVRRDHRGRDADRRARCSIGERTGAQLPAASVRASPPARASSSTPPGGRIIILDTRKTTPTLRTLENARGARAAAPTTESGSSMRF